MATKYYRSNNSDWNTDANWSTTSGGVADTTFPTSVDDAILDVNSGNCTLDADAACLSLTIGTVGSLYTGVLDFVSYAMAFGSGGLDCTYGGSATWHLGTSTGHTCAGNFDNEDVWTFDYGSGSAIDFTGTLNLTAPYAKRLNVVTFSGNVTNLGLTLYCMGGATITGTLHTAALYVYASLVVSGTLDCTGASVKANAVVVDLTGGTITGTGQFTLDKISNLTGGWTLIDVSTFIIRETTIVAGTINSATASIRTNNAASTVTIGGALVFSGNVTIENIHATNGGTFDNSGNYDVTYQGDLTVQTAGGALTWTKGTGKINLTGAANQNLDFAGYTVEGLVVNKTAGNLVMTGAVTTDSFTGTTTGTGDFDPNGQTITITNDCSWAAAFLFDAAASVLDGCTWIVGGIFTTSSRSLVSTTNWTLQVDGTGGGGGTTGVSKSRIIGGV